MQNDEDEWGSDNDEIYYDADSEEHPQYYDSTLNNQIAGTFSKWKCRSMLPLGEFIRRLKKNHKPKTAFIEIEKDEFECKSKELKERKIL